MRFPRRKAPQAPAEAAPARRPYSPPAFEGDFRGRDLPAAVRRVPGAPWRHVDAAALPCWQDLSPAAAGWLQPIVSVTVAVAGDAPGSDAAARLQAALAYLRLKVEILRRAGQLGRIADETLAMLPVLPARHTARALVTEASVLLRVPRREWQPAPEAADLGHPLPWYRPERAGGSTGSAR